MEDVTQTLGRIQKQIQDNNAQTQAEIKEFKEKILPDLAKTLEQAQENAARCKDLEEELVILKKRGNQFEKTEELILDAAEKKNLRVSGIAQMIEMKKAQKFNTPVKAWNDSPDGKEFANESKFLRINPHFVDVGQKTALSSSPTGAITPETTLPKLFENVFAQSLVFGSMEQLQMTASAHQLIDVSVETVVYAPSQNTTITDGTPTFADEQIVAYPVASRSIASYAAVEDSVIPLASTLEQRAIISTMKGKDSAILNGDSTSTHRDTDKGFTGTGGGLNVEHQFMGLRMKAIDGSLYTNLGSGGLAFADLITLLQTLDEKALDPSDVACAVTLGAYFDMLQLAEFKGVNVYGSGATAVTGKLMTPLGFELIPSAQLYKVVVGTGLRTTSGTFVDQLVMYNKRLNIAGTRKGIEFKIEDVVGDLQFQFVSNTRIGYAQTYSGSVVSGAYSS